MTKLLKVKGSSSLKVKPLSLQYTVENLSWPSHRELKYSLDLYGQVYGCLELCCQELCKSPHTIFFHDFLISVLMQCPKIGTTLEITGRKNGFVLFLAFSAQYSVPGRQFRVGISTSRYVLVTLCGGTNQA